MEQLFHEFVPPRLGMHYIVKIEVNDFHFIQFGSHGMRHHTKCRWSKSGWANTISGSTSNPKTQVHASLEIASSSNPCPR